MSVDELAKRLGKNRATIYRYESDDIENLPISIISPLAIVLETTPAYIMGWTDENSDFEPQTAYIKNRRMEMGLSQLDVAKYVGVSEATVSRWESGNIANMRRDRIKKLAEVLCVSSDYIINAGFKPTFADDIDLCEVLPPDEVRLIELYRLADELDKQTIRNILSRYDEKRSTEQSSIG